MTPRFLRLLFGLLPLWSQAADAPYAVSSLQPALLTNAHVVKRTEEVRYEWVNEREAVLYRRYAVTILRDAGKDAASFSVHYDKLIRVESVEGALYDAEGKLIRRVKGRDIVDQSAYSESFLEDNRIKSHRFDHPVYPYTVEYEVKQRLNHTFFMPPWIPQDDEHLSVAHSSFTFVSPAASTYRFRAFNYPGEPQEKKTESRLERTWTVRNLPAITYPFAGPLWRDLTLCVYFAPNSFALGNYSGDASQWESLGRFMLQLNRDRDQLPEATRSKVKELTAGITDPREKAIRLYKWLQQHTRYISIQLGIGGWQTFEARQVAEKGYGDCKALTNYMYSLLREAGINSYYTLISAGERAASRAMMEDFPSNQFNHAILCVPLQNDSLWLECTNQNTPAGYMGSFTGNRKALLVTPEGGKVVATPRYTWRENLQQRRAVGRLLSEGDLALETSTRFRAELQDDLAMTIQSMSPADVRKFLDENLGLAQYEVSDFRYTPSAGTLPELREDLKLLLPRYATITGKRLFLIPNLVNRSNTQLLAEEREHPIHLRASFTEIDSVEVAVPEGYSPEALPKPVEIRAPFGYYRMEARFQNNRVLYYREWQAWPGVYPANEWKAVRDYFNSIHKADRASVVLVKTGG